jgi:hypothetical protein|nr:MAG TPA: hypothetical protein [Caudoviricetes sp.]
MPKKPPLGHLPWITGRGAGGLITFILQRDFWKVKKNIEKVLKKYKKSIDFCCALW